MKKYLILGILAVIVLAAVVFLLYNRKDNDKSEIRIKVDEPQNDIFVTSFYYELKEIKNPNTGMITSDEDYIQKIADVMSQLKLKPSEEKATDGEIKYGWVGIEFKYNNSGKIVTVVLGGENEIKVEENKYVVENDNAKELIDEFCNLIYYIPEDIARKDELYPQVNKS